MIKIRNNTFETNSSSTHSIAIPIACDKYINHINFYIDEFGWDFEEVNPVDYLYTGILDAFEKETAEQYLNRLKFILDANNITYTFQEPDYKVNGDGELYFDNGYVDHAKCLIPFIDYILDNSGALLRYLTLGKVFTGNDNDYDTGYINREYPTYTDWDDNGKEKENPYYMGEGYEWYYKGN